MAEIEVSVIVPCYNEERHIASLLEALCVQTFPVTRMEVIIADGMSSDHTRTAISEFQTKHPEAHILIIDNPKKIIPAALNLAIRAANGEYIVRVDAHSIPETTYIETCIQHLKTGVAENVGGVWVIKPGTDTPVARAIAVAASHPLGVGAAQYRDPQSKAGFVDTVPFGSYRKNYLMKIGLYDESLLSNEDYELNARIRKSGGKIFLDPKIRCTYFSRENLKALAKQYYRYGFWKFRMIRQYPGSLRFRQFLPPAFLVSLLLFLLLGLIFPSLIILLPTVILFYVISIFLGTFFISSEPIKGLGMHLLVAAAIITMHVTWGTGFIVSGFAHIFRKQVNGK